MTKLGDVPCGGCHHCCQREVIAILPDHGDDPKRYAHDIIVSPGQGPIAILKHKPNGDCVYLGSNGCTIHGNAPFLCRVFDCRQWFRGHSRAERRKMVEASPGTRDVFDAGRERLHTLDQIDEGTQP